ncbi:MAG TPA: DMT family transporter [Galbitalea sp.]|nr:DMT family transporter [Galbitalea sp.]
MLPLVVLIGMSSALVFGSADFLGGLASKRISPLRVTAIAAAVGLVVLLAFYPLLGGVWSISAVLWGGLSGVSGALAISLLYACLAIGPMSILSPVTAVVSAVVPAAVGIFVRHDHFGLLGYVAIALALVAVVFVGFVRDARAVRPTFRGLAMAVASGIFIGLFLVLIDLTPKNSGIVPLIANRGVNAVIMITTVGILGLVARRRGTAATTGGWRPGIRLAIACGIVDAVANCGLLLGIRVGDLTVIAVLTALYPAGTIILAAIVLRERIAVVQYVGLALAITSGALLAID